MALIQTQAAKSRSPSPEIIGQNPPKRAYCDTCLQVLDVYNQFTLCHMEDSAEHCRACAGILEFLRGRMNIQITIENGFMWTQGGTRTPMFGLGDGDGEEFEFFTVNLGSDDEGQQSFDEPGPLPNHPRIWRMRAPSGDTSSTEAFQTLKSWISRCGEEHTLCQPAKDRPLPHRVLKIEGIRPLRVRVVEDYPRRESYACLSHRWGPQTESNSLKTHNLDLYKTGVPEENFYPLMKDAIEAAFRLDLRFIWIDCYCIIQDDIKDWEIAAAQMASIYEDAFLTISATFSEGGDSMFSTIRQSHAGIQITEIKGEPVFLRQHLKHPCVAGEKLEYLRGPLLSRGWVFQERLLSKRFVHFMQDEIFWECRESTWCECTSEGLEWKEWRKEAPRTLQTESWKSIVHQYQHTEFTFNKDRLAALAGIARRYGESHGLTYLAGLWKEHLPGALMWSRRSWNRPLPRPREHAGPTWSWISFPRCRWDESYEFDHRCTSDSIRFLGCKTQTPDADIYAGANHLEIIIEGPVLDLKVYKQGDGWHMVGKSGNGFVGLEQDSDWDPEEPTKYRSVPDGSSCLLLFLVNRHPSRHTIEGIVLLKVDSTEIDLAKYERIGYFHENYDGHYLDDSNVFADYCGGSFPPLHQYEHDWTMTRAWWLLDRAEVREVIII